MRRARAGADRRGNPGTGAEPATAPMVPRRRRRQHRKRRPAGRDGREPRSRSRDGRRALGRRHSARRNPPRLPLRRMATRALGLRRQGQSRRRYRTEAPLARPGKRATVPLPLRTNGRAAVPTAPANPDRTPSILRSRRALRSGLVSASRQPRAWLRPRSDDQDEHERSAGARRSSPRPRSVPKRARVTTEHERIRDGLDHGARCQPSVRSGGARRQTPERHPSRSDRSA